VALIKDAAFINGWHAVHDLAGPHVLRLAISRKQSCTCSLETFIVSETLGFRGRMRLRKAQGCLHAGSSVRTFETLMDTCRKEDTSMMINAMELHKKTMQDEQMTAGLGGAIWLDFMLNRAESRQANRRTKRQSILAGSY
jgi:hypothetical protein